MGDHVIIQFEHKYEKLQQTHHARPAGRIILKEGKDAKKAFRDEYDIFEKQVIKPVCLQHRECEGKLQKMKMEKQEPDQS